LLARVRFESKLAAPDRAIDALLSAASEIGRSSPTDVSARVATRAHRAAYEALGARDPYAEQKRLSNEVALKLLPRARDMYESSPREERMRVATLLSIVGNVLDFGIAGGLEDPGKLEGAFEDLVAQGLGRDDTDLIGEMLGPGLRVAYLTDNCGEVVFDQILIGELKARGCLVDLVVKGDPILTDATREDVAELGMDRLVDLDTVPDETRGAIEGADLVISKGMANLESLSDVGIRPIAYLLRTKCDPVARTVGEAKDINVAKLYS
jgi:uncharacterized protein with ATP-grasp and redox domains